LALLGTLSVGVAAQTTQGPLAGQWEIYSQATGMPRGGSGPATRSACISQEALGAGVEEAFRQAVKNSSDRGPECKYAPISSQAQASEWGSTCKGGPVELRGRGHANWSASVFSLTETLAGKSPMGDLNITRTIEAKRTGECSK
jgi:hypothetical protein